MSEIYETSIYYCFELNGVLKDFNDKNSVVKTSIQKPIKNY